jgi:opacity protein-like surface antigen
MSKRMKQTFLTFVLLAICFWAAQTARAQSDLPKFEAGGQFSLIRLGEQTAVNKVPNCLGTNCTVITEPFSHPTEPGFGGRVGYNVNQHLAIEAEMNFFPRDRSFELGRKLEGLFGVKAGKRFDKFGVFGKGRPGFLRTSKGNFVQSPAICAGDFPEPVGCFDPVATTQIAFDVGGVIEYYPTKRVIIRFDAGDTIVRFGDRMVVASVPLFNPSGGAPPAKIGIVSAPSETTHNFQSNIGVSFRF